LFERYICALRKAGSIAANERGPFDAGGRAAADPLREALSRNHTDPSGLPSKRSSLVHPVSADIDAGGLATVDRRLDFTPNPALSLRVWLRSNRDSTIGLVAEGLPRLLPRRGETTGQAVEIVAIVQAFWSGVSYGPNVAALELLSLRGRFQPEIVFGVLEIVLRSDRVAGCVSVARQLKVSLRHMQGRATNSDVGPARVI
jgi:hypothetical protein